MRKLNNKGLTLIELIVSIALISIVMVFLYRLLANINYESDNEFFASQNQEQRIEIIDYIETTIRQNPITKVVISHNANNSTIAVTSGGKVYNIIVSKDNITVKESSSGIIRAWKLQPGLYSYKNTDCNWISGGSSGYPFVCTIPVYTNNDDNNAFNNNTIDDIIISFISDGDGTRVS